jgi:hypothetical protein
MRPHAQPADERTRLTIYKQIIDHYLRYILIRCTAYTNDRTVAQRITAHTVITTCLLSDRLRRMSDLGVVVDTMIQMIGEDQVTGDECEVGEESPMFVLNDRLCEVAEAINGVNRFERELLVLHHIEEIETATLAKINKVSHTRIERTLAKAEREFVELLRGMSSWDHDIDPDVHALLNDLVACLDGDWLQNLGAFTLLSEHR